MSHCRKYQQQAEERKSQVRKIILIAILKMDLKGDQEILRLQGVAQRDNMPFLHTNSFMQTKLPL